MIDPEIMLGLHNSNQNRTSLELQREILAMQKLQVLNQIRISQGLQPLAELPQPPPRKPADNFWEEHPQLAFLLLLIFGGGPVLLLLLFYIGQGLK